MNCKRGIPIKIRKTCGCCGLGHAVTDSYEIDHLGNLWFDCVCMSTLVVPAYKLGVKPCETITYARFCASAFWGAVIQEIQDSTPQSHQRQSLSRILQEFHRSKRTRSNLKRSK